MLNQYFRLHIINYKETKIKKNMKKALLILILTFSFYGFSQTSIRTELNKEELKYLATNISSMFTPKEKDYENSIKNQLITYDYEIHYDGKVIFRDAIKKPSLSGISYGMNRNYATFCLAYDQFDTETKLEITESRKLYLTKDENGKKWFWADHHILFAIERNVLIVNDQISEKLTIRFFKNEH